ncbi:MAG: Flp family type IVb pilin [Vulcanimicrobiaceae bacterium]
MAILKSLLVDDSGQGVIEYMLIVSLVSVVGIVALGVLGGTTHNSLAQSATNI